MGMRLLTAIAILGTLASPAFPAATYNEGLKLMKAERYREAIPIFEREARLNPGSADVLMNLGWAYWHTHAYQQSWKVWDLLSKLDPKNPTYVRLLAELEIERKRFDRALALTDRALAIAPDDRDTLLVKAKTLGHLGRDAEAGTILQTLLERYPDYAPVIYANADHLATLGRLDDSLTLFDRAVHMQPKNVAYRRGRAAVLYRLGQTKQAVDEWKDLANGEPPDEKSIMNLGWASWADKKYEEALAYGRKLLALYPENPAYLKFVSNLQIELGDPGEALELSDRGLELSPGDKDLRLTKSKALFHLDRDKEAIKLLSQLLEEYPDEPKLEYHMADFLSAIGRGEDADPLFNKLVEEFPDNMAYRKHRAQNLYEIGKFDKAVAEWKYLTEKTPQDPAPFERLLDDAFNRANWQDALGFIRKLAGARSLSSQQWMRLESIYQRLNLLPQALEVVDKAIEADPTVLNALYTKGEILEGLQRYPEALAVFQKALEANPNNPRALFSIARVHEAQGDYKRAIEVVRVIQKKFYRAGETPLQLRLQEARLLADDGKPESAYKIVKSLYKRGVIAVPVLLFHGISKWERSDSPSQAVFKTEMEQLKRDGYTTITVEELVKWVRRRGKLPKRPILIAFDDGRVDSFRNADPILKNVGFKATMFVIFSGKRTRFHANVGELRKWRDTGRWDMQVHAGQAHFLIPIDKAQHRGHFLANRMWLNDKDRLETTEEFAKRVEEDFKSAKQRYLDYFPKGKPQAFAFPFGDYGQAEYSNEPTAPAINQRMIESMFDVAFVQDSYGFNGVGGRRWELSRYTIKKETTPRELERHLVLQDPWLRAKVFEAQLWLRTGQANRAVNLYDQVWKRGVRDPEIVAQRGVAYERVGNGFYARRLFSRAIREDDQEKPSPYYKQVLDQSKEAASPKAETDGTRLSDSAGRENINAAARARFNAGPVQTMGWLGLGRYHEEGFRSIDSREGGGSAKAFVLPRVSLEGRYTRRNFDMIEKKNTDSYGGGLGWITPLRGIKLTASVDRSMVETASALADGIHYTQLKGDAEWDVGMNWTTALTYARSNYSDDNRRWDARASLMRHLNRYMAVGYSGWAGDSAETSPRYWTPQKLHQHMAVVSGAVPIGTVNEITGYAPLSIRASYGAGYGWSLSQSRVVHSIKGGLTWRPTNPVALQIGAQYSLSPIYISRELTAGISLSY